MTEVDDLTLFNIGRVVFKSIASPDLQKSKLKNI